MSVIGSNRRKSERLNITIKRYQAVLVAEDGSIPARITSLTDIAEEGVGVFVSTDPGKDRFYTFRVETPVEFEIKCQVVWVQNTYSTSVISNKNFTIRAGLKFITENDEEKQKIKDFISSLHKE